MVRRTTCALVIAAVAGLLALAGSSGAAPRIGIGKMTVSPNSVTAGTSGNELTFTFTSDSALSGQTIVDVPRTWTQPQRSSPSVPGYVEVKLGTCSRSRIVSVVVRRITIATVCKGRQSYQLRYHNATAPRISADGYIFLTLTRSTARKAKLRPLGHRKQAKVRVRGGPVSALVMAVTAVATAGAPFGVTVRAVDGYGNNAAGYASTLTLTSTDPAATLPAPYAYGPRDSAQHTFTGAILHTTGTQRITATDSNGLSVQSEPITVSPFY
jgi:hypothetical protein